MSTTSGNPLLDAGKQLVTQAINYDNEKQYSEAFLCYREGIQLFLNALKTIPTSNEALRSAIRSKISDYISRAEEVQKIMSQMKLEGKYHEQIRIKENSTGYGYNRIFSRFLDSGDVGRVEVEDPYIRAPHQIQNFAHFCSVIAKSKSSVKTISLVTGPDAKAPGQQESLLKELQSELRVCGINLKFEFQDKLHDREIRFDNGWIVKIGRGLDYVKKPASNVSLGFHDYDFRLCAETTVDIFHQSQIAK